jgi:hypothetical protein
MMESSRLETIRIAFDYVSRTLEETSFFFRDIQRILSAKGFRALNPNHHGYGPGSVQLDQWRLWVPRFASQYFVPQSSIVTNKTWRTGYLAVTLSFANYRGDSVLPVISFAAMGAMNHAQAGWQYAWLQNVVFNGEGLYKYEVEGAPYHGLPYDRRDVVLRYRSTAPDESYYWSKQGAIVTVSLDAVDGPGATGRIGQRMADLWDQYAPQIAYAEVLLA